MTNKACNRVAVLIAIVSNFLMAHGALAQNPRNMLFYDGNAGTVATGRIDVDGSFVTLRQYEDFPIGWTTITPVGDDLVLFYNAPSRFAATARFNSDGSLTWLKSYTGLGWWTHVIGAGGNGVLFYAADDPHGYLDTGVIDTDGNLTTVWGASTGKIGSGHTHVVKVTDDMLLFIKSNPCSFTTGLVYPPYYYFTYSLTEAVPFTGCRPATNVAAGNFNTLLSYDGDSEGVIYKIDPSGQVRSLKTYNSFARWTHIASATNGVFLFYNADTGVAATGFVRNADGNFVTTRVFDNFTLNWTLIAAW